MRVVLIGPPQDRERLRLALAGSPIEIVHEAETIGAARESGVDADGFLVAPGRVRASRNEQYEEALTSRETEVLHWMAEGLPNKAIAARLGISNQTVKFHVASIYGKLGAHNRTDAVRLAIRRGLVTI